MALIAMLAIVGFMLAAAGCRAIAVPTEALGWLSELLSLSSQNGLRGMSDYRIA